MSSSYIMKSFGGWTKTVSSSKDYSHFTNITCSLGLDGGSMFHKHILFSYNGHFSCYIYTYSTVTLRLIQKFLIPTVILLCLYKIKHVSILLFKNASKRFLHRSSMHILSSCFTSWLNIQHKKSTSNIIGNFLLCL